MQRSPFVNRDTLTLVSMNMGFSSLNSKPCGIMYKHIATRFRKEHLALLFILLVASILLMRQIGDPSLHHSDSPHHRMDGIFILDFLREMPITKIYEFTVNYYIQYPALGIGYRPAFFPFVEAVFNGILGTNTWSSRLAILLFAVAGLSAWFKLIQRAFDAYTAFWASLLLVTTPFIVQWGWYTMAELPVLSLTMLTAYVFYRFTETKRSGYLYATAILLIFTVCTKQTAVFVALWFVLYVGFKRNIFNYMRRKDVLITIIIGVMLITPLAVITIWLGDHNIAQSLGSGKSASLAWRFSPDNLKVYLFVLAKKHLTFPALILSVVGLGWAVWKRDGRSLYFGLLILTTYVFFTYLVAKNYRYPIFWIPAFTLFAALPLNYLRQSKLLCGIGTFVVAVVICYQVSQVYAITPSYITGFDKAARYVLNQSKSATVFVDGDKEAIFVYFMRAFDPTRSMYVLRGHKILTSSIFGGLRSLEVHANSSEDIQEIFDKYGIEYIVVESEDRTRVAQIHQKLREFLDSGPFRLKKQIPIESNLHRTKGLKLNIYRYLNAKPITADYLEIRLPAVGHIIRAPIRHERTKQSIP